MVVSTFFIIFAYEIKLSVVNCSRIVEEYKNKSTSDPYGFINGMEKQASHYKELYDSLVNRDGKHYIIK